MVNKKIAVLSILCLLLTSSKIIFGQVNLQTGSATYSLSMLNWQDDKSRLNAVVALDYTSGNGLKVNDVSSNVGQGWSLIAGGVITRMQVGEPDDQVKYDGNGTDGDITKYPPGRLYASVAAFQGCPNALTTYPIYGSKNQVYTQKNKVIEDRQVDYFSFQFNGKSGMFVIDTANGGVGYMLGDSRIKISFTTDASMVSNTSNGIRTTIKSFTITDVDGLIYKFGLISAGNTLSQVSTYCGLSKVLQTQYCDANATYPLSQPKFDNNKVYHQAGFVNSQYVNPWIIGSWFLAEIYDPFTTRRIQFTYNIRNIQNTAGADITNTQANKDYIIIDHKTSVSSTPDIAQIAFPDGQTVIFNYAQSSRFDFAGEYALASIDIKYNDVTSAGTVSRFMSEYQLNTTYFILNRYGTPVTPYQKSVARLCLKSIKKIGVDLKEDTPPYVFDYYLNTGSASTDDFVPPPFFYAKDIYGYYNGNNNKPFDNNGSIPLNTDVTKLSYAALKGLCFLNATGYTNHMIPPNPKANYAENGLLKQIIYPAGGSITYIYSQNYTGTSTLDGGVNVSQTRVSDGGYSNDCANPIITNYSYVVNGTGSASSLWGTETPINSVSVTSHYQPEYRYFHFSWSCGACCAWHYQYPGILSKYETIDLSDFQKFMEAAAPVLTVASVIGDIMDVVNLVGGATGVGAIVSVVLDVIAIVLGIVLTCSGSNAKDSNATTFYDLDLNAGSPLPKQFKRVEIVRSSGGRGKTVEVFSNPDDYPIWYATNPVLSAKQRYAPWAYGLVDSIMDYDASGNLVKKVKNVYSYANAQRLIGQYSPKYAFISPNQSGVESDITSCKCEIIHTASQRNVDWTKPSVTAGDNGYDDPNSYNLVSLPSTDSHAMNVDFYGMYTGRTELQSTFEWLYTPTDQSKFVNNYSFYTYNSRNFEISSIQTGQSNGDVTIKYIDYTCDYTGGVLDVLYQNNVVNLPVESYTTISKIGGGYGILNERVTEFVQLANGDIKPSSVLEQRFTQPATSYSTYHGPGSSGNPAYKQSQAFVYNTTNGNLIGLQDEGGHIVTNVYDYNDKYVVANVIDANPVTDKVAYTSFETQSLGGWSLSGTAAYSASVAITGKTSLTLGASNTLSATLNTAKSYILSFWATSNVTVSSATLVKSAPVINGLTYYEYNIAQGVSSVSIAGTATIDELRLYPKNTRMRTTTFDPLIGKTSECDENNRITYYEYDNLGRLLFVKDESKNILKMNEYNTVSALKQTGCPASFSNPAISETFTRNNCGAGYQGGDITFTVPAAKYTSTVSQADVDIKAEVDLLSNGQTYANSNGACAVIYYNVLVTKTDSTESCEPGKKGGWVSYTVPAGRYSSIISQADANQKAYDDTAANAQAYVNSAAHASCTVSTDPDWESAENPVFYCQGSTQYMLETDMNPNSLTHGNTMWVNVGGGDGGCPTSTCGFIWSSSITNTTTYNIHNSGTTTSFMFVFSPSTNTYTGSIIGQITGGCVPPVQHTVNVTDGTNSSRKWDVTFYTNGQVQIQLTAGPAANTTPNPSIVINGSF